jgi:hypothetical protein
MGRPNSPHMTLAQYVCMCCDNSFRFLSNATTLSSPVFGLLRFFSTLYFCFQIYKLFCRKKIKKNKIILEMDFLFLKNECPPENIKGKKQVMRETWAKQQIHKLLTQSFWITNNFAQNDSSLPLTLIFSSLKALTKMRKKKRYY